MEKAGRPGEKVDSCSKEPTPPCQSGAMAFKGEFQGCTGWGRGGGYMPTSTVSSDSHLEVCHAGV